MGWYYVKENGTATGDGGYEASAARTGTWNASTDDYYSDIKDMFDTATTPPGDGDKIMFSHLADSSFAITANQSLNPNGAVAGAGIEYISVDNANQDQYKPGAQQTSTGAFDLSLVFNGFIAGVILESEVDINTIGGVRTWVIVDSTLRPGAVAGDIDIAQDSLHLILLNTVLDFTLDQAAVTGSIKLSNGVIFEMYGGSVDYYTGTTNNMFVAGYANGGCRAKFVGVDMSTCNTSLVATLTNAGVHDNVLIQFIDCNIKAALPVTNGALISIRHRVELFGTDDTTSDEQHRFHVEDGAGLARNNDATYVTATKVWFAGTAKSSIEVITTSLCSHVFPFIFTLPEQYIDMSDVTKDVLYLDILVDNTAITALTDTDIAFLMCYPDGTTKVIKHWLTTGKTVDTGNLGTDPLAAGTELTNVGGLADGDWTKVLSDVNATQYRVKLDTSGDIASAGVATIRVEVYKSGIVAGDLFIHPLITVAGS